MIVVDINDPELEQNEYDAGGGAMWKYQGNYFTGMVEEYVNGTLRGQIEVQNGREEGVNRMYYESGQIEHEYFIHNNGLHGIFRIWNVNGDLISQSNWVNGKKV